MTASSPPDPHPDSPPQGPTEPPDQLTPEEKPGRESVEDLPEEETSATDENMEEDEDVVDRPYEVVGEVKAEVRKGTIFSKEASQAKVYRELWERGRKLKADAVIKSGLWGRTRDHDELGKHQGNRHRDPV